LPYIGVFRNIGADLYFYRGPSQIPVLLLFTLPVLSLYLAGNKGIKKEDFRNFVEILETCKGLFAPTVPYREDVGGAWQGYQLKYIKQADYNH
jgi:hypothetical protein